MENCDAGGCGDMKREGSPNLERIGRKILVLSGKGGVGKSSVACLAPELPPLELVTNFLAGSLRFSDNVCDH